jgi:putative hydrolase of the HAD superfamily
MTKPSVVVFDLGKVLLDFDYSIAARKIAAAGALTAPEVKKLLDHSPLLYRYETGLMTKAEFFGEVREKSGFRGPMEDLHEAFSNIFWEIEPMIRWQAQLRTAGVPTYILSNTNEMAVAHIRERFPFFAHFDGYILSYEIGAMKPHAKIYEALEAMAGKRGREILYLDDRAENIDAAVDRGWHTILQESPEQTFEQLPKFGFR